MHSYDTKIFYHQNLATTNLSPNFTTHIMLQNVHHSNFKFLKNVKTVLFSDIFFKEILNLKDSTFFNLSIKRISCEIFQASFIVS